MVEKPLYQDEKLKIDYLPNSIEDHLLYIKGNNEERNFVIPRRVLSELARTPRGGIERKIATFNDGILYHLNKQGIGVDGLHIAICQASAEEEERIKDFIRTQKTG